MSQRRFGSRAFWQYLASRHISVKTRRDSPDAGAQSGKAFMFNCQMRQTCFHLNPTAMSVALKCLSLFIIFSLFPFFIPKPVKWRRCRSGRRCVMQRKCLSQFGETWQKLPFISRKIGHINFGDLHNNMPHVISAECFQSMLGWWCVLSHSVAGSHTSAWHRTVTSQQEGSVSSVAPVGVAPVLGGNQTGLSFTNWRGLNVKHWIIHHVK